MGQSSELHIEMHNEAMANDAVYAAEYYQHWLEEMMLHDAEAEEWESATDWRLDALTGYMEFRCPLCPGFADNDFGHRECHYREQAWADGEFQYFN